jgi:2-keto-3-deoxy-L-rhamnonate aldolase RhmA
VRHLFAISLVSVTLTASFVATQAQTPRHNKVIALLESKQPVFGLYAPSNRRGPGGPQSAARATGTPAAPSPDTPPKSPAQLAQEAAAYKLSDFVFDGSMEGDFSTAYPAFAEFAKGLAGAGIIARTPHVHLTHPMIVKSPELRPDLAATQAQIGRQLNLGVSGIMLVTVETADEARAGVAAMRFKSKGGVRPDAVEGAPAVWGMSEAEYRRRADVWPLNPEGELINWTIVESRKGLENLKAIAAVPGIGVLWPGAGTLRGVFSTTDASGQRQFDQAGWEQAIQSVLGACKANKIACGFPANTSDIELRMKQGFNVFVMNWGDAGFKTVEAGRKIAGRTDTTQ